ncbi:amino acid adenylation domain-containing protein [Streptomyces sp. A7024]|uniref:Amino acid adenylation domain-containing protein n=1 Tax=Streptomyces coryli TaxID=1128680 RepID=A0A6G4TWJ8_9ACTN|nr:non-ribosomal peptide synthetase [Streptomyces coryli]NGN63417.1 amino acid adenylation domain-containing protein [Streptomyces coryli]
MIPLSYAQRRMWFLHRMEGESENWNMPAAFRLTGSLDRAALAAAIRDVVDRHEVLRTVYVTNDDGELHQRILPTADAAPEVPVVEVPPDDLSGAVEEAMTARFDLAADIPVRVRLFRCSPQEHVLVLVVHHIAADGSSFAPLIRDLAEAYTARRDGAAPQWEPLPVQYKDYTVWHRELLGDVADPASLAAKQIAYWRGELAGVPQPLNLPVDRPRPAEASGRGAVVDLVVGPEVGAGLQKLADERGVTLSMALHAALAVLLCRIGGGEDVTIGSSIAGRTDEALADLVGFFVNTQVLRVDLAGDPRFTELLAQVRNKSLAAYEHQDVPFDMTVEAINPVRSAAYNPLFQVMLGLQNYERSQLELPGLTLEVEQGTKSTAKVDLFFNLVADDAGALRGDISYAVDLFDRETVEAVGTRFVRVLEQVVADPGVRVADVDVLSAGERQRLVVEMNDTAEPTLDDGLVAAVRRHVAATPEALAVIGEDESLSYRELDARSSRLAHWLVDRGVRAESRVAVCLPRTVHLVVALLAVLKAGGASVPIDPDDPRSRIDRILEHADPVLVLDADAPAGADCAGYPDAAPEVAVRPDNTQYVTYLPGPAGELEGVETPRGAVANSLATTERRFPLSAAERMLFSTSVALGMAHTELYLPLVCGAAVVLAAKDTVADASAVAELMRRHEVTAVQATPAFWQRLLMHEPHAANGLRIIISGEVVPERQARLLAKQAAEVFHVYGPAEMTTWCTGARVKVGAGVPIGVPAGNTRAYVLDARLRPVPRGVPGELYVAGAGMARGYRSRPELTAERLVACPYGPAGARMYRTGDLVRWDSNEQLEYLGRTDRQVQIQGFRVEPAEIERVLAGHPGVARAAVVPRENQDGGKRLVGYVVPEPDVAETEDGVQALLAELPAYLRERLADHLVPSALIPLPEIPLTPDGRPDPGALPSGDTDTADSRGPRNSHEEKLCALFSELLGVESVGVDDDFFELGGHSLLATRLSARIRSEFDLDVPLRAIIKYPTVAELAALLIIGTPGEVSDPFAVVLPLNSDPGTGKLPLWFLHGGGGLGWAFFSFALHVQDRPAYSLQSRGWNGVDKLTGSVEEMVEDYVDEMVKIQPEGPFQLVGWSYGGTVVHAVAEAIDRRGREIAFVAILDSQPGGKYFEALHAERTPAVYREEVRKTFGQYFGTENRQYLVDSMARILANNVAIMSKFEPPVYRGDVLFFNATLEENSYAHLWRPYVLGSIEIHDVRSVHTEMHMPGPAAEVMEIINSKMVDGVGRGE